MKLGCPEEDDTSRRLRSSKTSRGCEFLSEKTCFSAKTRLFQQEKNIFLPKKTRKFFIPLQKIPKLSGARRRFFVFFEKICFYKNKNKTGSKKQACQLWLDSVQVFCVLFCAINPVLPSGTWPSSDGIGRIRPISTPWSVRRT